MSTLMNTPVSPKVIAGTIAAALVAAVLAAIQGLAGNADFIASLPLWAQPFVPAIAAAAAAAIAGYLKRDHLRDVGQTVVTDTTVPVEVNSIDAYDDDLPLDR